MNFYKNNSKDEVIAGLKKALLNKAYQKASRGTSYLIESVRFKKAEEKIREGKITRHAQIIGSLHLSAVKGCEHGEVIKEGESAKLSLFYHYSKIAVDKVQSEHVVVEQTVSSLKINDKSIYGLELGVSYQDALRQVGRFSFDWQVNEQWRLVTLGRNTVLFFEQDVLVGGQYHRHLLPTVWSNLIELSATKPLLEVNGTEVSMTNHAMSGANLTFLEKKYSFLDYDKFRISEDEVELRLSGLVIGKVPNDNELLFSLACYEENNGVQDFIDKHHTSLPKFYNQTGEIGLLTGCNQVLLLWKDERFKSLLLSERANFNSAQFIHAQVLSRGFSDWSFYGVNYLQGIESNSELLIKHEEDDVYEVNAGGWQGYFVTDDGLAFQGNFYLKL
ncbi:hypothetical protein L1077_07495 [Pseudoalteromonas luteoviolacea]|uniref:hypothetical protein n=1 Tax=Pseudoalteromonas luteoviolacea TaxID=43657 RepID=UPI001F36707D|nr:hypothetical protein [Pseudoalteromonas luteoviolacea]MCF6439268.1 hypothetical protein [Pseudoalteromonas luteoviolacea]